VGPDRDAFAWPDLDELLPSWLLHLRAERKSPETVKSYGDGVRAYLAWCRQTGAPLELTRPLLEAFVVDLIDAGRASSTALSRHNAVRRFCAWLAEEGEVPRDELAGCKGPRLDQPLVDPLSDDELRLLIKACAGPKANDKRDEAVIRLMAESAARAGEVAAMRLSDVQVAQGVAVIRRGKGGKGRLVPFSPYTARALDRYLRARRTHPLADTDALWLGQNGQTFTYYALWWSLRERARRAGIEGMHPHRLRHTGADRWLAKGGTEGGLMTLAGWESPEMLRRYTRRRAAVRAIEEARRLDLGDL